MEETSPAPNRRCPACGAAFTCGSPAGQTRCWCFNLPPLPSEDLSEEGCLCPACLRKRIADRQNASRID